MELNAEAKKRLALLIEEREAPLAPLAAKIGVSQSTLWNFLYGGTKNFSKIHRLATELKVSLDWIMQGDAPSRRDSSALPAHMAEGKGGDFKHAPSALDKNILVEVARCAVSLARDYPGLKDQTVMAIALAIGADLKAGKLPMPGGRDKAASKTIAAEARKLALYELGKSR